MTNLYLRLQIPATATTEEIKKAYWRLARQCHPDAESGDSVRFQKLREAYGVLSDPQLRQAYDQKRADWAKQIGALLCAPCGTANVITRRPQPGERIVCARCQAALPLDVHAAVRLQKARLIAEAARVVDDVGSELAVAAASVLKAQINKLRKRWTEK